MITDLATELLTELFGPGVVELDRLRPQCRLREDLGADSLDLVELQFMLEERDIAAPDEAFTVAMSVGDFDRLITASRSAA